MFKKKYFLDIYLVIAIFIILYTIVLSITVFNKNKDLLNTQNQATYNHLLQQTQEEIDNKLFISRNLMLQLKSNNALWQYVQSDFNQSKNITSIALDLKNEMALFPNMGMTISLTKFGSDIILSPGATTNVEKFRASMGFDDVTWASINDFILRGGQTYYNVRTTGQNGKIYLSLVRREYISGNGPVIFFLSFEESHLFPQNYRDSSYLILKGQDIISWSGELPASPQQLIEEYYKRDAKEKTRTQIIHFVHNGAEAYGTYSTDMDWKYLYVNSGASTRAQLFRLVADLFLYLFLFLAIGLILAVFATKKLYRPVDRVVKSIGGYTGGGRKPGDNELAFIGQVASALKNANADLQEKLQLSSRSLKNKFVLDLAGGIIDNQTLRENLARNGLEWLDGPCNIYLFEFANYATFQEQITRENAAIVQQEIGVLLEQEIGRLSPCIVVETDFRRYLCLADGKAGDLKKQVTSILTQIEGAYNIRLIASSAENASGVQGLYQSYSRLTSLMDYSGYLDKKNVIWIDQLAGESNLFYHYPLKAEQELIESVADANRERAFTLLHGILEENLDKRELDQAVMQKFLYSMVVTIDRIAGRLKLRLGELFGEDAILYLELRMCKDKEDLRAKLVSIYQKLLSSAKSKNESADNTLASSMIQYVKKHYHEDLSLTDLADRFNLSSNYISTLFKTFTGENFRDYTNISKIDRAIEIMKETPSIKIYDVAKMVGYDNANSFIRMFKRYKGVTPGQYMKSAK